MNTSTNAAPLVTLVEYRRFRGRLHVATGTGANLETARQVLSAALTMGLWKPVPPRPPASPGPAQLDVLDSLETHGELTVRGAAEDTGRESLHNTLLTLRRRGLVARRRAVPTCPGHPPYWWRLTTTGRFMVQLWRAA